MPRSLPFALLMLLGPQFGAVPAAAHRSSPLLTTLAERKRMVLLAHITKPWPSTKGPFQGHPWGPITLAFSRLALYGPSNSSLADEISAEVEGWSRDYLPWDNYTAGLCPLSGLGELPLLARMALLPRTRELLSAAALAALEKIFAAWLSPRSKVEWAASKDSWLLLDGTENIDATRKASLYLAALALNYTQPRTPLELDGKTVAEHAAAWESHWISYFQHRAVEGIGVEMGSPTYAKYTLQNYLNIADFAPGSLGELASNFLQLWFADAAQAFLPTTGVRGGAHNRVYRGPSFFSPQSDGFRGFSWLYGWWRADSLASQAQLSHTLSTPQLTLFATSTWEPLSVVSAMATAVEQPGYLYTSRRLGDEALCDQPLGPVDPQGTRIHVSGWYNCTRSPCKPCVQCRGVLAFEGSSCNAANLPTSVVKQEYVGANRHYTLGAIRLHQGKAVHYGGDVGQNHQVGAFFGGTNPPETRLVFGDSGSVNCSDIAAFQRHVFLSITSRLVAGAMAVARPSTAKINGCSGAAAEPSCHSSHFPLFAFVSAALYITKTVAGDWDCFNAAGESYACVAITGPTRLTASPVPCRSASRDPSWPAFWNGTLLLFNGSSTSRSIGVLQMGSAAEDGGFSKFVATMAAKKISDSTDAQGNLRYASLHGGELILGVGGVLAEYDDPPYTYLSPFISAPHKQNMEVTLSAPGEHNATLSFDAREGARSP
jgi:hypothetical protein